MRALTVFWNPRLPDDATLARETAPWRLCTRLVTPAFAFDEAVLSWNARGSDGAGARLWLQVGTQGEELSAVAVGEWGEPGPAPTGQALLAGLAELDVDVLRMSCPGVLVGASADLWPGPDGAPPRLDLLAVAISSGAPAASPDFGALAPIAPLAVGPRSQWELPEALAPRVCSPTALAILMAYHGVNRPTVEVAAGCYDAAHNIYGNWTRAAAYAGSAGLGAWVARFSDWKAVHRELAAGWPVMLSISYAAGELPGAMVPETCGHLVVVCGLDADRVWCADPAGSPGTSLVAHSREAFGRAFFGHGGYGIAVRPPAASPFAGERG